MTVGIVEKKTSKLGAKLEPIISKNRHCPCVNVVPIWSTVGQGPIAMIGDRMLYSNGWNVYLKEIVPVIKLLLLFVCLFT